MEDLKAYGADESSLPKRFLQPIEYEVWPEHENVVLLFLRCQTQWRTAASGVMGLDYGPVFQMMDLYAVDNRRQLMEDLQVMEGRAKELINAEAVKAQSSASKATMPRRGGRRKR